MVPRQVLSASPNTYWKCKSPDPKLTKEVLRSHPDDCDAAKSLRTNGLQDKPLYFSFLKCLYFIFERESEREREREREREMVCAGRGRERGRQNPKRDLRCQHRAQLGLDPMILES